MSAYRAGQRVRIEWPNGSAVEGVLKKQKRNCPLSVEVLRGSGGEITKWQPSANVDDRTVTILRPEEPTGLGAVVEAEEGAKRREWVRMPGAGAGRRRVWHDGSYLLGWDELTDPVVLSDGWVP